MEYTDRAAVPVLLAVAVGVGLLAGSASALFLVLLHHAEQLRLHHGWMTWLLPVFGFVVGFLYYRFGGAAAGGNNLIISEYHDTRAVVPLRMAPLVLVGTVLTHLGGGSAGREGTAVQMGAAIADSAGKAVRIPPRWRRHVLSMGVAAGFASVFGTPLAGIVFALEVMSVGAMRYGSLLYCSAAAFVGVLACQAWGVHHTHYSAGVIPQITVSSLLLSALCGTAFGLIARSFSAAVHACTKGFAKIISYAPLRPALGGLALAVLFAVFGLERWQGLGVPAIAESFSAQAGGFDWLLKLALTAWTLGSGFKGGEVTPLFFIGATAGSALAAIVPLPVGLLAAMGFVAVFAGATNTPIACIIMGGELFGFEGGAYCAVACIAAYYASGHTGIYSSQVVSEAKHHREIPRGTTLSQLNGSGGRYREKED